MTPINLEVGISGSASSGAQLGGDFNVTGGGGAGSQGLAGTLASALPKVGANQGWIVYAVVGVVVIVVLALFLKLGRK